MKKKIDSRNELFLESDSSVAYTSLSDDNGTMMNATTAAIDRSDNFHRGEMIIYIYSTNDEAWGCSE